jgi:hypothetical protein
VTPTPIAKRRRQILYSEEDGRFELGVCDRLTTHGAKSAVNRFESLAVRYIDLCSQRRENRGAYFFAWLFGKLTPVPKKHSFSTIFPSLSLKRSVLRKSLPSLVHPL